MYCKCTLVRTQPPPTHPHHHTQNCIYIHDLPWSNGCQVNQIDCNGNEFNPHHRDISVVLAQSTESPLN